MQEQGAAAVVEAAAEDGGAATALDAVSAQGQVAALVVDVAAGVFTARPAALAGGAAVGDSQPVNGGGDVCGDVDSPALGLRVNGGGLRDVIGRILVPIVPVVAALQRDGFVDKSGLRDDLPLVSGSEDIGVDKAVGALFYFNQVAVGGLVNSLLDGAAGSHGRLRAVVIFVVYRPWIRIADRFVNQRVLSIEGHVARAGRVADDRVVGRRFLQRGVTIGLGNDTGDVGQAAGRVRVNSDADYHCPGLQRAQRNLAGCWLSDLA